MLSFNLKESKILQKITTDLVVSEGLYNECIKITGSRSVYTKDKKLFVDIFKLINRKFVLLLKGVIILWVIIQVHGKKKEE